MGVLCFICKPYMFWQVYFKVTAAKRIKKWRTSLTPYLPWPGSSTHHFCSQSFGQNWSHCPSIPTIKTGNLGQIMEKWCPLKSLLHFLSDIYTSREWLLGRREVWEFYGHLKKETMSFSWDAIMEMEFKLWWAGRKKK